MLGAAPAPRRVPGLCATLAGALALGAPAASAAPFVYAPSENNELVSQFSAAPTGALSALAGPPATGLDPQGTAIAPDGDSVYVANPGSDNVSQYDVAANGALSPKSPATVAAGDYTLGIAVSPDGDSAYVTNSDASTIGQYDIGANGELSPKATATIPTAGGGWGIALSPDGRHAYAGHSLTDRISIYDVGSDGSLTPAATPSIAVSGGVSQLVVSPDGSKVYAATGTMQVGVFDRASNGTLTAAASPPALGGAVRGLAVAPDGRNLYAAFAGGIAEYGVGPSGGLTLDATAAAGLPALGIVVSPDGQSAYVTESGNTIRQYDIAPAGTLTPKSPASVAAGAARTMVTTPQSDMALSQSVTPDPVGDGGEVTYTLTVTNAEGVPASGVTVTDTLPADMAFLSATPSSGSCTGAGTFSCTLGPVAQGGTETVTVRAKALRAGTITNTATVSAIQPDPNPANDSGSATVTVDDRPGVTTTPASGLTATGATLNGVVLPGGRATTYRFDYGTTTAYGQSAPAGGASAGSGTRGVAVAAAIAGLAPGTTYHYRVVAVNAVGQAEGDDATFTTAAAPTIPPAGGGAPTPAPTPTPDRAAPKLAGVSLAANRLSFRVSEGARVAATIQKRVVRRVRRGKKMRKVTSWTVVRRVRASTTGKATMRIPLTGRRLGRGSYRVTVRATDQAGNASKKMVVTRSVR